LFCKYAKKNHKRIKDNKGIYSDTRQERLNKERKKNQIERRIEIDKLNVYA
jgi:hypothetical protein